MKAKANPFEDLACPDCGVQPKLLFDASTLLERQFEGLSFLILPSDNEDGFVVEGSPDDASYLDDFNMVKHLKDATALVHEAVAEGGSMWIVCPKCGDSIE